MWYGWIPSMGLCLPSIKLAEGKWTQASLAPWAKKLIHEKLGIDLAWVKDGAIWAKEIDFGEDGDPKRFQVYCVLNDGGQVAYLILWSRRDVKLALDAVEVEYIDNLTGMVRYRVHANKGGKGENVLALQMFKVIRDLYHAHLWTREGDFGLLPIKARDQAEASQVMFNQFEEAMGRIKMKLRGAYFRDVEQEGAVHNHKKHEELCAMGVGNCLFMRAMVKKAELSEEYLAVCDRLQESFENIRELWRARCQCMAWEEEANHRKKVETISELAKDVGILGLTSAVLGSFLAALDPSWGVWDVFGKIGWAAVTVVISIMVIAVVAKGWKITRRFKQQSGQSAEGPG